MSATVAAPQKRMTIEEFLALPDDGHRRWLIDGIVYPKDPELSLRNKKQGSVSACMSKILLDWSDALTRRSGFWTPTFAPLTSIGPASRASASTNPTS
jgi:hypothetical protein